MQRYLTPMALFDQLGLVAGRGSAWWGTGVLAVAGCLLLAAGGRVLARRDLSV